MQSNIEFTLSFGGGISKRHQIDLYDVSQALIGFQRSIALTTHLIVNGEIITQAPALKRAVVLAKPPEEGSWKITAIVITGIVTGAYHLATAPSDTPLGHLVYSAYDYVIKESLGVHVDYNKSLGQLYDEYEANNIQLNRVEQNKADALLEKCHTAIKEIHRPIYKSKTAEEASISGDYGSGYRPVGTNFNIHTFDYIHEEFVAEEPEIVRGRISSYNSNTFRGRIYVTAEGRPISFELHKDCRSHRVVRIIVDSLSENAVREPYGTLGTIYCKAFRNTSKSGYLKSYTIVDVDTTDNMKLIP